MDTTPASATHSIGFGWGRRPRTTAIHRESDGLAGSPKMREKRTNALISASKATSIHPNVKCPVMARMVPVSPVRPSPSPRTNAMASHGSVCRGNRNRYAAAPRTTIWIVARIAEGSAGKGNGGHDHDWRAAGKPESRTM